MFLKHANASQLKALIPATAFALACQLAGQGNGFQSIVDFQTPRVTPPTLGDVCTQADLDGDGDLDLVICGWAGMAPGYYLNHGVHGFGSRRVLPLRHSGARCYSVATGDFDNDGDPDIVTAESGTVSVHENLGASSLSPVQFGPPVVSSSSVGFPGATRAADLNGDGIMDLVIAAVQKSETVWLTGVGRTAFGSPKLLYSGTDDLVDLAIEDFDGDGRLDVLLSDTAGRVKLGRNIGASKISWPRSLATIAGTTQVQAGDLNGDGLPEVVIATASGIQVLSNRGSGYFLAPSWLTAGDRCRIADLDRDGANDLVICGGGQVSYQLNVGAGSFAPAAVIASAATEAHYIADLDQDGYEDVITIAAGNGESLVTIYGNKMQPGAEPYQLLAPASNIWSFLPNYGLTIGSWLR